MTSEVLVIAPARGDFAALNWAPLFEDHGIPLAIMGLFVVFAALMLVRIFIGLLPRIMALLERIYPDPSEAHLAPKAPRVMQEELSSETLAVIAAVVAHTVRVPHRIVHTRDLSAEDFSWTVEGRRQHHASHKIERRDHRN